MKDTTIAVGVLCQNSAQPASTIKLRSRNQAKLQHANGLRGGHEHLTAEAPIGGAVACPSSLSLVGTLSISGGTVRRKGLLVRLYRCPAVIRRRALRDRRDGHGLYAVGRGCPDSSIG